ncbi:hypothetical protein Ae356Ps1_6371 [Pseudonocardia sp. Ae356_Ps1]|nr:hypothetical protein Ae150APs1_6140 [Pseudonocardia sp. Ae150A_Ps1]OLL88967.1 hypothetical protein Ae356Ps1_6371 [Pseudonocardia sp. Ae356_Ps1]
MRQQGADIDSLYEISERIDTKIDNLSGDVTDIRRDVESLRGDVDSVRADNERRFDALDQQLQSNRELLTQILQRLQA